MCDWGKLAGIRPAIHGESVPRRRMHRRKSHFERRLFHSKTRDGGGTPKITEHAARGNRPPHDLGILQPENRPPRPIRRHQARQNEIRQAKRQRFLGNQHRFYHRRLPIRRKHQHRSRRPDDGEATSLRRGAEPPEENRRELEN